MLAQRNPWAIGLCAIGAILLWAAITLFVALFGLGQIGPNIDLGTLPAWLWYYRGDPRVVKAMAGGLDQAGRDGWCRYSRASCPHDPAARPSFTRQGAVCARERNPR